MEFDFQNEDYHELQMWGIPEKIIFETADSYIELLSMLTTLLGRQPEIPDWAYHGVWLGVQGGTEVVIKKLQNALDRDVKIGAIWVQDWVGRRTTSFGKRLMWNWDWKKSRYPNLDEVIKQLERKEIKVLGYINPYLAVEGGLFKEASEKSYLVKTHQGTDYLVDFGEFFAGMMDFTNPEAFQWYKEVIQKNLIDFGFSGWMADFGEYLPTDAVLFNGVSGEKMHNLWPLLWAKVNRDAVKEAGKMDQITFFMRSGYTYSQKYCMMIWAGDQMVDWSLDDGFPSVITAALSLAMTGFGLHHSDIGGYTSLFGVKRSKELFMRWAEMAVYTPVMRTHEGNRPDENWQFDSDEETLLHFAQMSQIHVALAPYIKAAIKENAETGLAVMRPLFLHYEFDKQTYMIQYQYLFGRDLLISPVYKPEHKTWNVYLPKDKWVHLWTGKTFTSGEVKVDAPLGYPPVFYREESPFTNLFKEITQMNTLLRRNYWWRPLIKD